MEGYVLSVQPEPQIFSLVQGLLWSGPPPSLCNDSLPVSKMGEPAQKSTGNPKTSYRRINFSNVNRRIKLKEIALKIRIFKVRARLLQIPLFEQALPVF